MATLRIPSPLRPYADGKQELQVHAPDVDGALQELVGAYPALHKHLFTQEGQLRQYVNIFVNEDNARDLQGGQTPIAPSDTLLILPSIAGGKGTAARNSRSTAYPAAPAARLPRLAGLVSLVRRLCIPAGRRQPGAGSSAHFAGRQCWDSFSGDKLLVKYQGRVE